MTEVMSVQALSIDNFTKEELANAYETLIVHQEEFLSDYPLGSYLRQEALKHFKDSHPECKTIEQLAMMADLEDDVDIKNACVLKIDAEKYAEDCIKQATQQRVA